MPIAIIKSCRTFYREKRSSGGMRESHPIPYSLTRSAIVKFLASGGEQKDSPLVKSLSEAQEQVW